MNILQAIAAILSIVSFASSAPVEGTGDIMDLIMKKHLQNWLDEQLPLSSGGGGAPGGAAPAATTGGAPAGAV
jgi:hypothetical protein